MKVSIKGVVLYHLFPSLHGTQYKYFSKKLTYKERISRRVVAATGGERLAVEVCRIEGDTRDK